MQKVDANTWIIAEKSLLDTDQPPKIYVTDDNFDVKSQSELDIVNPIGAIEITDNNQIFVLHTYLGGADDSRAKLAKYNYSIE